MLKKLLIKWKGQIPALIMLALLCLVFAVSSDSFWSLRNMINIVMQMSPMSILAIGLTFVVIAGNLDLSGGSVIALVGVVCAILLTRGFSVPVVVFLGLLVGAGIGFFNGFCVAYLKMPSFIMTMSTSIMVKGLAFAITGGSTIYGLSSKFLFAGAGRIQGIPVPVLLVVILFVGFQIVLTRTIFGYHVQAVGENARGARMAGIVDTRVQMMTFVLAGILYAIAAMVLTGQLGAAVSTSGANLEMTALSCLAIGGISLSGGRGNLMGAFLGCLIIGVLSNGVNLLNLSPYYTDFIRGLVIFGALFIECARYMLKKHREGERYV